MMTDGSVHRVAERAAREAYGRLVAILAARSRDVAAAEDALATAFRRALETWPGDGVPKRPEGWLLTVARRELGHGARHDKVRAAAGATLADDDETPDRSIPDERLCLLFACTHPAIDPAVQAPLMLQVVLGLDAERIAGSFLASPSATGQRLVRAKAKIRDAGISFEVPGPREWASRLDGVLAAVYAAYGTGWEDVLGEDPRRKGLAAEAIWLGRVLAGLIPDDPEVLGLLALMLYCEARRAARRGSDGAFVPLQDQDVALWDSAAIREAEALLTGAARLGTVGRCQIEAAIQSVHVQRAVTGQVNWPALVALYDALIHISPTIGAAVARAAAQAESGRAEEASAALDEIADKARSYQPFWAAKARCLELLGEAKAAARAYKSAAGLTEDSAVRSYLLAKSVRCESFRAH